MITLIIKMEFNRSIMGDLEASLLKLTAASQRESGCLAYSTFKSMHNTSTVVFIENWASDVHLKQHRTGTAVTEFKVSAGEFIVHKEILSQ